MLQPSVGHSERPGIVLQPSVGHSERSGIVLQPSVGHSERSGIVLQPSVGHSERPGIVLQPSVGHSETSGIVLQPSVGHSERPGIVLQLDLEISRRLEPLSSRTGAVLRQLAATDPQNEPWNVLTHGDLWVSNILLSADSSRLRFVDFQQCRYGSPALDLSSVLFLCMDGPTRTSHTEHVLRVYHESLRTFLKELGSNPDMFPFEELQRQLTK